MTRWIAVLGAALLATAMGVRPAAACSCASFLAQDMFSVYAAVFRGSPISFQLVMPEGGTPYYAYQFLVTSCWKGQALGVIELRTDFNEASSCGVFIPGDWDVIVYAFHTSGVFYANLCSVVHSKSDTGQAHLEWLGEPDCSSAAVNEETWGGVKALYR